MHDVFFFTDIHGRWNLYNTLIEYCKHQDPECTIIFGGDACDRGPDGYKIMKHLLSDPQIIYLKGNHEQLFVAAAKDLKARFQFPDLSNKEHIIKRLQTTKSMPDRYPDIMLSVYNGGDDTLADWIIDGMPMDLVEAIDNLPLTFSYENYDFCHAGAGYKTFESAAQDEYTGRKVSYIVEQALLWDRSAWDIGWKTGRICVHGHTPTVCLPAKIYGKDKSELKIHPCCWIGDFYSDKEEWQGLRIDMDTGATFAGRAYVLNVLTQNVIGFYDPSVQKQEGEITMFEQYKITSHN